jgi:hypothetical protein
MSVKLSSHIAEHQSCLKPLVSGWLSGDGRQSIRSNSLGRRGTDLIYGDVLLGVAMVGKGMATGNVKVFEVLGRGRSAGGRLMSRGPPGIKKPLPALEYPEGVSTTRRLGIYPHGALTSEAAYPLQRSSWQGLLLHE